MPQSVFTHLSRSRLPAAVPSALTMTVTCCRARSVASSGSRLLSPWAQRNSIATLRPSVYPASPRPFRNAARALVFASGEPGWRNPMSGVVGCSVCAVGGSAVVAAPIIAPRIPAAAWLLPHFAVFIRSPHRRGPAARVERLGQAPSRSSCLRQARFCSPVAPANLPAYRL